MTSRVRAMVGVMSTLIFLALGVWMLVEGDSTIGGLLVALAAYRAFALWRQLSRVTDEP